jgi:selenocysteine-specific elongation factor
MRVIGTAGHVDHGKSTLVEALSGTHPDRLKEEREREMTIDLGFAWLTLPDGEEVGIIDVPGHRDFIENMLAGVGGIDAALFVIAADEGVMPQTREHLSILDLLQIQGGVVALTKIDMVDDAEWLELIEDDIRRVLAGTVLEHAPIIRVSGKRKIGLPALISALSECLREKPARPDYGKPRLPIDRVFSIAGFGTVVTGTLSDGQLQVGDEVEILPQRIKGRVRGLQSHKRKEDIAVPGSRTAVNISGVNIEQVLRGNVLIHPRDYQTTARFDAKFRLLPDASTSLHHNTEVKLYIGAAEVVGRVRLLGSEELNPGETGWIQLETGEQVVVVRGDRYILRRPSPGETLGGGIVLDPHPKGRHKRFAVDTMLRLEALEAGTPAEVLQQSLHTAGAAPLKDIVARSNLDNLSAVAAIGELTESGVLVFLESYLSSLPAPTADVLVTTQGYLDQQAPHAIKELSDYHQHYPLRRGMPREELKSRMKLHGRIFTGIITWLAKTHLIHEAGPYVWLKDHEIRFTLSQERAISLLLKRFAQAPYSPPTVKECLAEVGEEVYQALIDSGKLVPVASDVVFSRQGYDGMVAGLREIFTKQETVTAAQIRDYFNTSRRYALAFLEYLDLQGITVREGDARRLKR